MRELDEVSVTEILGVPGDSEKSGTKSIVLSCLRRNPEGVTAKLVASEADVTERRAREILKDLCYLREAYNRKLPGIREHIYYPNGQLIHKYLQESRDIGSQIFRISIHEGRKEPRVQIQERDFSLMEGEKVIGSIFIELNHIPHVMEFLNEMLDKFNLFQNQEVNK